jgi:hypothetical protein
MYVCMYICHVCRLCMYVAACTKSTKLLLHVYTTLCITHTLFTLHSSFSSDIRQQTHVLLLPLSCCLSFRAERPPRATTDLRSTALIPPGRRRTPPIDGPATCPRGLSVLSADKNLGSDFRSSAACAVRAWESTF